MSVNVLCVVSCTCDLSYQLYQTPRHGPADTYVTCLLDIQSKWSCVQMSWMNGASIKEPFSTQWPSKAHLLNNRQWSVSSNGTHSSNNRSTDALLTDKTDRQSVLWTIPYNNAFNMRMWTAWVNHGSATDLGEHWICVSLVFSVHVNNHFMQPKVKIRMSSLQQNHHGWAIRWPVDRKAVKKLQWMRHSRQIEDPQRASALCLSVREVGLLSIATLLVGLNIQFLFTLGLIAQGPRECRPPNSVMSYIFPSVVQTPDGEVYVLYDGKGDEIGSLFALGQQLALKGQYWYVDGGADLADGIVTSLRTDFLFGKPVSTRSCRSPNNPFFGASLRRTFVRREATKPNQSVSVNRAVLQRMY